jgi:phosphate transport system permease protein
LKRKYFYLAWEIQIFLFIFVLIVFDFERTFQVLNPSPRPRAFFAFLLIIAETLLIVYAILKEKAVKGILLTLSSSTTFIVFLIVIFVFNEGLPAFSENGPLEFITGEEWQPNYDDGITERVMIKTIIKDYDFEISVNDTKIYIPPFTERNTTFTIKNTGGIRDSYSIEINTQLNHNLILSSLELEADYNKILQLLVSVGSEGQYPLEIIVRSDNSNLQKKVSILIISSPYGVNIYPENRVIDTEGHDLLALYSNFTIKNTGIKNDSYILSINASHRFKPSISGIDSKWDYESSTGIISLAPNETKKLRIKPRFLTLVEDSYDILISAVSQNYSNILDEVHLLFNYKFQSLISIKEPTRTISETGIANYQIEIEGSTIRDFSISIGNLTNSFNSELILNNETVLFGEGSFKFNMKENGTLKFNLSVIPIPNSVNQDDWVEIKITIIDQGIKPTFGMMPFIIGTIITTTIAVLIAAPLGIGCAIFMAEYCPIKIKKILKPLYELLAGIPSVIYGLWGFITFGPFLADNVYPYITNSIGGHIGIFAPGDFMSRALLTASIVLAIMILPIIIALSHDAIGSVSKDLRAGSLALGASRWQTMKKVILPNAKSGITASIILGTGRAIGETMAVIMIMGAFTETPTSVFDRAGTMTSVIASSFGWSFTSTLTRHALFGIATTLFIMIFILNVIFYVFYNRANRKPSTKSKDITPKNKLRLLYLKFRNRNQSCSYHLPKLKTKNTTNKQHSMGTKRQNNNYKLKNENKKIKKRSNNSNQKTDDINIGIKWSKTVRQAKRKELFMLCLFSLGALIVTLFLFLIIGDVIIRGFFSFEPEFIYTREIAGGTFGGGFANAVVGSLLLVGIAIGFAAPLSIGSAIYVQEYAKKNNPITKIILFTSDTLASVPSIVYGAFGFMFFVLYLNFKFSLLAGGLTLAFMVIPLMLRSSIEAIKTVSVEFKEAAYALGASRWQTIRTVILPAASPGIVSGVIISMGRAIGETAAVMLTAGYAAHINTSLMQPVASMPNMIFNYYELGSKFPNLAAKIYSVAFLLIIMVLLLNFTARLINRRAERMLKGK